ncbi:MAG: hypothetical protein V3V33_09680 [Candidatus Lokiarchaeia archaeon]
MYNEIEDPSSEYEITLNKLSEQIKELFSKIHYYQAVIGEKEFQIKQLLKENQNLIVKVQKLTQKSISPPEPSQKSYTPPPPPASEQYYAPPTPPPIPPTQPASSFSLSEDPRINKRQCPNCGAVGFAIREVDDKTKVLSYSPRRMYAKKKACTKCRYEW